MRSMILVALFAAASSGCMSLSGLDGESKFACKAPEGVACESVSGVYANPPVAEEAMRGGGPGPAAGKHSGSDKPESSLPAYPAAKFFHAIPSSGTPLLSPPRVLRIWIAPWKDQDGDLRDQSYLYVMWDRGEWNIQHTRDSIRSQYAPVRLAPSAASAAQTGPRPSEPETPAGAPAAGPEVEHVE